MKEFLQIREACIGYQFPLIEDVSVSLGLGEIALLVGNNGVGKTSLIHSILSQNPLLKGDIYINQKNIKNLSTKDIGEQVAMVFSKANIPPNYSVLDIISFGKYIHYPYYFSLSKADKEEIDEIVEKLHLQEYRNTSLLKLSDGNLQKAFIGRALAQNSPMIILDEPTTHLDEDNKIMILSLLRNLAKEHNKCILFSSHDWRLAKEFSDKIWWITDKKLIHGMTEDVLLHNQLLTQPKLFSLNPNFKSPKIIAPPLEKEMAYSALQKNFNTDLSNFALNFSEAQWHLQVENLHEEFESIEQLIIFLQNIN